MRQLLKKPQSHLGIYNKLIAMKGESWKGGGIVEIKSDNDLIFIYNFQN